MRRWPRPALALFRLFNPHFPVAGAETSYVSAISTPASIAYHDE